MKGDRPARRIEAGLLREEVCGARLTYSYIPIGGVHRLANPGRIALELIEVQTGSYLGEDDIIRIDDIYRRN